MYYLETEIFDIFFLFIFLFDLDRKNNVNGKCLQKIKTMQFAHQPLRIQRTFVLEDEMTSKTKVIPFEVIAFTGEVDLFPLFSYALPELKNLNIKIYDFRINKYVDIATIGIRFHVPNYIFENGSHVVLIKYSSAQSETLSINSIGSSLFQDNKSETHSKKTERSKQRVILEVIQIVKKWRKLCESKRGVTMTLAQAAKMVGLPKKSLDDYYYQLRMGQKYGFDYHGHMMERIGTLRSFLKKFKTHRKGDKNEKLPNILKISDQIDGYENLIKQNVQFPEEMYQEQNQNQKQHVSGEQGIKKESIQKEFYNQFNYSFGRQMDPFLTLGKTPMDQRMICQDSQMSNDFEMFF